MLRNVIPSSAPSAMRHECGEAVATIGTVILDKSLNQAYAILNPVRGLARSVPLRLRGYENGTECNSICCCFDGSVYPAWGVSIGFRWGDSGARDCGRIDCRQCGL